MKDFYDDLLAAFNSPLAKKYGMSPPLEFIPTSIQIDNTVITISEEKRKEIKETEDARINTLKRIATRKRKRT